jgi:hypothetical protein
MMPVNNSVVIGCEVMVGVETTYVGRSVGLGVGEGCTVGSGVGEEILIDIVGDGSISLVTFITGSTADRAAAGRQALSEIIASQNIPNRQAVLRPENITPTLRPSL